MVWSSSGLIITHSEEDMIVSGSFFFCSELRCTCFCDQIPFFEWLIQEYQYCGLFIYDDFEQLVEGLNSYKQRSLFKQKVLYAALLLFGDTVVQQYWNRELTNLNKK